MLKYKGETNKIILKKIRNALENFLFWYAGDSNIVIFFYIFPTSLNMHDQLNYLIATCASYLNRKYKWNERNEIYKYKPFCFSSFFHENEVLNFLINYEKFR